MLSLQPITVADLILSRLLLDKKNEGLTKSTLKDSIKTIISHQFPGSALTEHIEQVLSELEEKSYVHLISNARYQATNKGKVYILSKLQLEAMPARAKWETLKNIDWLNYALDLPAQAGNRTFVGKADGLKSAILQKYFQLPIESFSTLTKVRNALLWQQLCDPTVTVRLKENLPQLTSQAFNQGAVMGLLLNDLLQATKDLKWEDALKQLIAKAVNARQTGAVQLRLAILRQAVSNSLQKPIEQAVSDDQDIANAQTKITLGEFSAKVLEAAKSTQTGRFGDHRIFISHVWKTLNHYSELSLSLEDFKQQLIEANRQRLLTLSRADLAHTLDAEDVSASEVAYLNSTFHFILLD